MMPDDHARLRVSHQFVCLQEYAVPPQQYSFGIKLLPLLPTMDSGPGDLAAKEWLRLRK